MMHGQYSRMRFHYRLARPNSVPYVTARAARRLVKLNMAHILLQLV